MEKFDLIIGGAGPAGCTLALLLGRTGLKIALIEKQCFPRDKICGDALSGQVIRIMKRLPDNIYERFLSNIPKSSANGIRFTSPDFRSVDIPFHSTQNACIEDITGYVCRRRDFDLFLMNEVKRLSSVSVFEKTEIKGVSYTSNGIMASTNLGDFTARIVAAADGAQSVIRRSLHRDSMRVDHHCLGIRAYYDGVSGIHSQRFIEMIFLREILPGYFWIFPGEGGITNVGFGMLIGSIRKQRIQLSSLFQKLVTEHSFLAPRFRHATLLGKPAAFPLPLGSHDIPRSIDRCLFLGDAASLVDPFTGEGIGNAMASAEIAAKIIMDHSDNDEFSSIFLEEYDRKIIVRMGNELRISSLMQKMANHPWIINLVIRKACHNPSLQELLSSMYLDEKIREKLTKPAFYTKLLLH